MTMGIVLYSVLLILSLGITLLLQSNTMLLLFVMLVLLLVGDLFLYGYTTKRLGVSLEMTSADLKTGVEVPVKLCIANPTLVPIVDCFLTYEVNNGFYESGIVETVNVPVMALSGQQIRTSVTPAYCGCYTVKITQLSVWDLLHIHRFSKGVSEAKELLILPQTVEIKEVEARAFVTGTQEAEESQTKGSDFPEVQNVREYIPGDRLKDIHWKLSTKLDKLMVKEHVSMSASQIMLVVEMEDDGKFNLEHVMNVCFSLAQDLQKQSMAFTLCWWSEKTQEFLRAQVTNQGTLEQAFMQLMYEPSVKLGSHLGKGNFGYTDSLTQEIIWIRLDPSANVTEQEEVLFEEEHGVKVSICTVV